MKKKFKLIASLASLCVAVALLVFGVYAAATVTYSSTISVSYTFSDALVKVERRVDKLTTNPSSAVAAASAATQTYTNGTPASFQTYNGAVWANPTAPSGMTWTAGTSTMSDPLELSFNTSFVYRIVITVSSPAANGVNVSALTAPTVTAGKNVYVQLASTGNFAKDANIKATAQTYTFYIGIIDATVEVADLDITFSMSFAKA